MLVGAIGTYILMHLQDIRRFGLAGLLPSVALIEIVDVHGSRDTIEARLLEKRIGRDAISASGLQRLARRSINPHDVEDFLYVEQGPDGPWLWASWYIGAFTWERLLVEFSVNDERGNVIIRQYQYYGRGAWGPRATARPTITAHPLASGASLDVIVTVCVIRMSMERVKVFEWRVHICDDAGTWKFTRAQPASLPMTRAQRPE